MINKTTFCQNVDTLKLPKPQSEKLADIQKQLKEAEKSPEVQKFFTLQTLNVQLQEAAFEYKGLPVPARKEFNGEVILYIKDEAKK